MTSQWSWHLGSTVVNMMLGMLAIWIPKRANSALNRTISPKMLWAFIWFFFSPQINPSFFLVIHLVGYTWALLWSILPLHTHYFPMSWHQTQFLSNLGWSYIKCKNPKFIQWSIFYFLFYDFESLQSRVKMIIWFPCFVDSKDFMWPCTSS